MKKFIITLGIALMAVTNAFALSTSAIRENARFLTDRMAYELDMTPRQTFEEICNTLIINTY